MSCRRAVVGAIALAGVVSACHRPPSDDDHMAHMPAGDLKPPAINATGAQGAMNLPPSANTAAARVEASPRHGEWVKLAWSPGSSDSLMAWIVYPSTNRAKSPVVVVVHEIFGLQTWVRGVADQLASEGFIAIAPDLISRVRGGPSTVEISGDSARKLITSVPPAERVRGITAAASYAMSQASAAKKYGVIGFCWGGQTVWVNATAGGTTGYAGGVAFYGPPYSANGAPIIDSLRKITTPIMLLSGAKDQRIGAEMPAVDSAMKALGKSYYGHNYEGAEHGFARAQDDPKTPPDPAGQAANLAAIKDAWPRTIAFLKKNLGI